MEASSALSTPVRKPVLPVKIEARVGEQTGYAQTLSNVIPSTAKRSRLGMLGFIAPIGYPGVASMPRSSAMMNKIFGGLEVGVVTGSTTTSIIGSGVSTASFLQLIPKKSKDKRSRIFLFILDRIGFGGIGLKDQKLGSIILS